MEGRKTGERPQCEGLLVMVMSTRWGVSPDGWLRCAHWLVVLKGCLPGTPELFVRSLSHSPVLPLSSSRGRPQLPSLLLSQGGQSRSRLLDLSGSSRLQSRWYWAGGRGGEPQELVAPPRGPSATSSICKGPGGGFGQSCSQFSSSSRPGILGGGP